ncbi:cellulase family glycosylhydrolase [Spirochaetia bacterium 38H-sp]|uniref:Cellulase family glycosylhydrolase n=1 Tax=Rarispira pelagica TaxID=3141764 RepID=A0ABU9U9J2_9SPIR
MKNTVQILVVPIMLAVFITACVSSPPEGFRTASELVEQMTVGWNLGNTMDAIEGETSWGNPETSYELLKTVREAGFDTLRIPVTWGPFMDSNYKVASERMQRVKQIVDWAKELGFITIVNIHHEDSWLKPQKEGLEEVKKQYKALWKQIAETFKDYGDFLIFEAMNEPRLVGTPEEWSGGTEEGREVINELNLLFVDTVRSSGGFNRFRTLLVTPYGANAKAGAEGLVVPDGDNIAVSIHSYDPFNFTFASGDMFELFTWDGSQLRPLERMFDNIKGRFIEKGIPVILTEFGSTVKEMELDNGDRIPNTKEVAKYASNIVQIAKKRGIKTIWWDNGKLGVGDDFFALLDRNTLQWAKPEIVKALIEAAEAPPEPLIFPPAKKGKITASKSTGFLDEAGRVKVLQGSPVIDGQIDDVWQKADFVIPGNRNGKDLSATAKFKLLWDAKKLYILAYVEDPELDMSSGNPWEHDSFEIFLDENGAAGSAYDSDDIQFRVSYDGKVVTGNGDLSRFTTSVVPYEKDGKTIGYIVEASIDWLLSHDTGNIMGFDMQVNDASGGVRIGTLTFNDNTNSAWQSPAVFGQLRLY